MNQEIIEKALEFGASLAGIANVKDLKTSPSHTISPKMDRFGGVGTKQVEGKKQGEVTWPENAGSAVVIAVAHPDDQPEMDWWVKGLSGGTIGNARLISVFATLAEWIEAEKHITCIKIPYHIEYGGVFMKDAAVMGGLGCVGKNNILVTPEFGSRVRLRVMLLEADLPSSGPMDFAPCAGCEEYCRKACPRDAFDEQVYTPGSYGQSILPARTGVYDRHRCNIQMEADSDAGMPAPGKDRTGKQVKFCRRCELACPVGRSATAPA